MVLQLHSQVHELLIALRKVFRQLGDRLRCTHTGNHVLALCVDQVLAVNALLTGGGVTCERNAGTGGLALVAEYHGLYVNGSAPVAGDVVHAAVYDGAGVVPGTEHGLHSAHQLILGILRELLAVHRVFVNSFETIGQILQIVSGQLGIKMYALSFLHLVDDLLEVGLRNLHYNVGVHLDESAVGVVCESGVAGLLGKAFNRNVV